MDTTPFKNLIQKKSGICFDRSGSDSLRRGISDMMSEKGIDSPDIYLDILIHNQDEFFKLLNLLTVNETYFFREPAHIKLFSEHLVPELLKTLTPGRKLNILSAGCSTGEEPYSLAIALMDKFGPGQTGLFSITGIDIDSDAIKKARDGIYTERSFRGAGHDELMKSYFDHIGNNRYKLHDIIKHTVKFQTYNLLNEPGVLKGMDIIWYRNVSIYFEQEVQKKIFRNLSQILNEKGYLIVSSTETLSHNFNILSLIETEGLFLFHKNPETEPATELSKHSDKYGNRALFHEKQGLKPIYIQKEKTDKKNVDALFNEALSMAKSNEYQKALTAIDDILETDTSFIKGYTLKAGILLNLQDMDEAKKICLNIIEKDIFCMEGHLILGLIAKYENNREEALKRFKEALYISSSSWLAHFYMAEIYQSGKETECAAREYQNVLKLLDDGHFNDHGLTFFHFPFSERDIRRLCQHNIKKSGAK
ncbi:MAG: hypothetical protein GY795_43575 [Desulfobacterales bacterium]|nr:hypothetical protein [Desulfobacterales bacterium]